jgi:hypothetical protein
MRKMALACFLAACGGDATPLDAGTDATIADSEADAKPDADAGKDGAADVAIDAATDASADVVEGGVDAGSDADCQSLLDGGCYTCCQAEDPDAAAALLKHAFSCACGTASVCASVCASSLCIASPPDTTCMKCLTAHPDAGNCILSAEPAACGDADIGCAAVVTCLETCP